MQIEKIGHLIRFHRKHAGLSQEELGLLASVGKTVIFDIEKGKLTIRLTTLLSILKVLNITIAFQSPLMRQFNEES